MTGSLDDSTRPVAGPAEPDDEATAVSRNGAALVPDEATAVSRRDSLGGDVDPSGQTTTVSRGDAALRAHLIKVGDASRLSLPGLRPDRAPVIAGGLAIMSAVFRELGIEEMITAPGSLREGIN